MVNVRMQPSKPTNQADVAATQKAEPIDGVRGRKMRENQEKLRALRRPGIRVVPAEDHPRLKAEQIRKYIKHAPSGVRFREGGSIEWPDDRFTQRRLREGVIKRVDDNENGDKGDKGEERRDQRQDQRRDQRQDQRHDQRQDQRREPTPPPAGE
jgi:hypothetical protein